jgi:NADPH:quinone reductase
VVIDPLGLRTASLDVMGPLWRLLACGNVSGDWQHNVEANRLWVSNHAILPFRAGSYLPTHPGFARPGAEGTRAARSKAVQVNGRILNTP